MNHSRTSISWVAIGGAAAAAIVSVWAPVPACAFESDDFHRANLDPGRWTFVNPLGDGWLAMSTEGLESRLLLSVPEGPSHDPWFQNQTVRVSRPVPDEDLSVVVRFESEPAERFQMQGLFVEADADNRLRFDTYHDGTSLRAFIAVTAGGESSSRANVSVAPGAARFMRVDRTGDDWTLFISDDGEAWSSVGSTAHTLAASTVSVFVANHADVGPAPAYTAIVDYVFDVSAPIAEEDGTLDPDVWDPLIHTVATDADGTDLTVNWFTDEPAMGRVEFGETESYGSVVSGPGERHAHSIELNDLTPGTTLHYRIVAEDGMGHESVTPDFQYTAVTEAPVLDVWYGANQPFGHIGRPQTWVNVLGNVSDPDGVESLVARVNGGADIDLTIGPDGNRLVSDGDFNVDLPIADLIVGPNEVALRATDALGHVTETVVTVDYLDSPTWPTTYAVNWSTLATPADIPTVAHVVDGQWSLDDGNLRTVTAGYDRLVAMGDVSWDDYEVRVPVTIHSSTPWLGVGILLRWSGHTDNPIVCAQPKCGWLPLGAICWYRLDRLEIYGNGQEILGTRTRTLDYDVPYWFKARVATNEMGGLYQFKVWEVGLPEPASWDVTGQEELTDPQTGSMMLLTHRADVSFGNVAIHDLATTNADPEPTAPAITLAAPAPNPFARSTDIGFTIARSAPVSIRVYDVSGRLVRELIDRETPAGSHTVRWDGRSSTGHAAAPGVYYYTLDSGLHAATGRVVREKP